MGAVIGDHQFNFGLLWKGLRYTSINKLDILLVWRLEVSAGFKNLSHSSEYKIFLYYECKIICLGNAEMVVTSFVIKVLML